MNSLGAAAASDVCTAWQTDRQMQLNTTCALIGNPKRPLAADGKGGIMGQLPTILPGLTHTGFRPLAAGPIEITEMAMHDELVVDGHPDEVRAVLETPPAALSRWAERTPMLRTDMADMGHHWQKV